MSGPRTLADSTAEDCAAALMASLDRVNLAAQNASALLRDAGFAGYQGDTADDLHLALSIHTHLVRQFEVKIRTATSTDVCTVSARTSLSAYTAAADSQGDTAFSISVMPVASPNQAALEAARVKLGIKAPLDTALNHPTLGVAIRTVARKPPKPRRRKASGIDFKSLAANDRD